MNALESPSARRKADPFQSELRAKMKERRSRGLSTDITPTDESEDEALGSDDDLLAEFNLTSKTKVPSQPVKATGRTSPFDPIGKAAPPATYGRKSPFDPFGKSPSASKQQPQSVDDVLFGRKTHTGKLNQNGTQEPEPSIDDLLFGKKQAPLKSGLAAGDQQLNGRDPMNSLFDKDGSPRGQYQKKQWQPPSYKKNSGENQDYEAKPQVSPRDHPFPPPRRHKASLSEDSPRSEDGKWDHPKAKPRSTRFSTDQPEEKTKPRRQPKVDIFGSSKMSDDEEDEEVSKSFKKNAKGRASPAPGGRKTPSSRSGTPKAGDGKNETASGRKSPAKSSSILGILAGDSPPKPKPRKMKSLLMSDSEDEGEENDGEDTDTMHSKSKDRGKVEETSRKSRKNIPSPDRERESSLCREIEEDPDKKIREKKEREKERAKRRASAGKQTQEHNLLENTIDLVADVQDDEEHEQSMKYIEPATPSKSKTQEKSAPGSRPGSSTTQVRPKPRYAKPQLSSPEPYERPASFDSTTGIRQAVYDEWYKQKMERSKQELREKKKKEKEEEERKKKEKEEKVIENQVTYKSWAEKKKPVLQEKMKEKRKEQEKKREKEQEELEKRKAAEVTFKRWKETKDEELKDKHRETKQALMEKKQREAGEKATRKKDTEKVYEGWKSKKDSLLKTQFKETKKVEKEEKKQVEKTQKEKEEEANRRYEMWIENKEKQQKEDVIRKKVKRREELDNPTPAWFPSGRTIPFREKGQGKSEKKI